MSSKRFVHVDYHEKTYKFPHKRISKYGNWPKKDLIASFSGAEVRFNFLNSECLL
jgi:hypothetical protein